MHAMSNHPATPVLCSKMTSVMDRIPPIDGSETQAFQTVDDDTHQPTRILLLSNEDWEQIGRPDVVTVAVEPGDHLNEADRD